MKPDQVAALCEQTLNDVRIRGNEVSALCPFHDEKTPSWGMKLEPPYPHFCFGCHSTGTLYSFLVKVVRLPHDRARDICFAMDGTAAMAANDPKRLMIDGKAAPPMSWDDTEILRYPEADEWQRPHRWLTQGRGLVDETIRRLGLRYDATQKRVLFFWYDGQVFHGATGRYIGSRTGIPKTLPYFGLKKGRFPYVPARKFEKKMIVVEGEMDAAKVYQAGYRNVMALGMGSANQAVRTAILRGTNEIVLFFDNDQAGRSLFNDVRSTFACIDLKHVPWESYKTDPGDLTAPEIENCIEAAKKLAFDIFTL